MKLRGVVRAAAAGVLGSPVDDPRPAPVYILQFWAALARLGRTVRGQAASTQIRMSGSGQRPAAAATENAAPRQPRQNNILRAGPKRRKTGPVLIFGFGTHFACFGGFGCAAESGGHGAMVEGAARGGGRPGLASTPSHGP